ncbi:orotate phosphoribosyltransferase [Thermosynechococcus vestitus]|uniref:Orotate phosphoribosyltransferase n=1 Tax=Thermosynechococcus vestitus (strain NIES-2133 / IAM M-273 / BP-1) TaxID=197221 RepID=PYRE_THEVB|nr:orotate phosphoribosyltransferase [Thermosynechococcus vestitus]Q8DHW5.1 RecName: Full=Orotate phosphoribosyltransferase; Short=OPRT; Short=OPRTase [Thermosynechococcus vestitus BP-1]BAC09380.1 orotate phosphoribosyl transferase [Thermosynechococcus vestitus BP-1]BAY53163.1 orotate phosphoribosyl transferase [Thermostichus vulcanus NIES-2134]
MDESLADLRQELLALLCRDAYRAGDFTLSSGQKSQYYINCKPVTLSARGAYLVGRLFLEQLAPEAVAVAGLTLGADPLVVAVSVLSNLAGQDRAALIVRKEAKGHGTMSFIEGPPLPQGAVVTVLEDVITTGGSALKAVGRLQEAGYVVNEVLGIVDRQGGGAAAFAAQGIPLRSLFQISDLEAYLNRT